MRADRGDTPGRITLDHRPRGHDEIAHSRLDLLFQARNTGSASFFRPTSAIDIAAI